ncbi:MAG: type II CAAX endopeptidase family protein [Myxococcota bacterium]
MPSSQRLLRLLECAVLFGLVPGLIDLRALGGVFLPLLLSVMAVMAVLLWRDPTFDNAQFGNLQGLRDERWRILTLWIPSALAMMALTVILDQIPSTPSQVQLFALPRSNPALWVMIMLFYPLFSVYPQELVFRAWFFHRYEEALGGAWPTILIGGALFGWAHILFENWVAVVLCIPGGILFGYTYHRSRSLLASGAEHALYGDWVFTVGLGWLFYSGSVVS